ncbi:MAG TPA: DNA/RNA nuclease SfsA [Candidatus Gallacutalibacter stercoravium]|nr:DNA/RNA nuclease SfsA [Candidatus Gallacutalibacter stercoravium]
MRYEHVCVARFLERPNRFTAWVEINGNKELCHVKNTGRCKELLMPGANVVLSRALKLATRKTQYDLIAVYKNNLLINIDSQAPNAAVGEWLINGGMGEVSAVRPEFRYGDSRLDFYLERPNGPLLMEVKGVTLEENGQAYFPDAPTERGIKHVQELCQAQHEGYQAYLLFVVQMKGVCCVKPNLRTHPAFAQTLEQARKAGVVLLARDCIVTPDSMTLDAPLPVLLPGDDCRVTRSN